MPKFQSTQEAYQLFHEGQLVLAEIEHNGVRVDKDYLDKTLIEIDENISKLEIKMRKDQEVFPIWRKRFGDNIKLGSRKQLAAVLQKMGYNLPKTASEAEDLDREWGTQVNKQVLEKIGVDVSFINNFQEVEQLKKVKSTYLNGIKREMVEHHKGQWYVHPSYNLNTVATFRSSCDNPNFQNVPVRNARLAEMVRRTYIPPDGWFFVEIDFGQLEVRIANCYHKDPTMGAYLHDPKSDMHKDWAAKVYCLDPKQVAKNPRYACNTPEAPIWMFDGSFKTLGEIKVGDKVMGWIREGKGKRGKNKRGNIKNRKRLVTSVVKAVNRRVSSLVKVTMESGRVIRCTPDHLWFNGKMQFRGKDTYHTPMEGRTLAHVVDIPPKISEKCQYVAGWLGGVYDGEGSRVEIVQSQKINPDVCDRIEESFAHLGIRYTCSGEPDKRNGCLSYRIAGLQAESDFLNLCKPTKSRNIRASIKKRSSFFKQDKIVKVEPDGEGEVISMETSTGNYVAWGYASKNCKNMWVFPQFYGSVYFQCAPALWEAIDNLPGMSVKEEDDNPKEPSGLGLKKWLKKQGIRELGNCDSNYVRMNGTKKGTFIHHLKQLQDELWLKTFPVYDKWKKDWYDEYQRNAGFQMLTGFAVNGYHKRNDVINYPVQGSAFHCLLWCLIRIQKWLRKYRMKTRLVGQIHDSLQAAVPASELQDFLTFCHWVMTVALPRAWKWINCPIETESEVSPRGESWFSKQVWTQQRGVWAKA